MQLNAYLSFNGNCREAMLFYQECLGGELLFQAIGASPLAKRMPKQMKDCILHATLTKETLVLQGTDMVSAAGLLKGNAVSLSLNCNSEAEIKAVYAKLSANGQTEHALEVTFWGALFVAFTDKYGHHWLLNYSKK